MLLHYDDHTRYLGRLLSLEPGNSCMATIERLLQAYLSLGTKMENLSCQGKVRSVPSDMFARQTRQRLLIRSYTSSLMGVLRLLGLFVATGVKNLGCEPRRLEECTLA